MKARVLNIAALVIGHSDREKAADAVLRAELKAQRGLAPADLADISRAVFSYYRWLRWTDEREPLEQRIIRATELAREFSDDPTRFADRDLVARAVPEWIQQQIPINADFARAIQREPILWLRARVGKGRELAQQLGDCQPFGDGALADTLKYTGKQDLFLTPQFHTGDFEVQDISSQAVGLICAPAPGQTWLDACAGEGGKLLHLSELMRNTGLIWAGDRAEWRLRRLKRRAARAGVFNYRSALWDGGSRLPTKGKFDGVLVDAPCTGTGTWQRNPHARWTLLPSDVQELKNLQLDLLVHAAAAVKPGGKLVYSVCSLTRSETTEVVERFQSSNPQFAPLKEVNPLDAGKMAEAVISLWPQDFGGNGMFIACWKRT